MNVEVNYDRDDLLTDYAVGMLKDFYMIEGEESPQEAYARVAEAWVPPIKMKWTLTWRRDSTSTLAKSGSCSRLPVLSNAF